MSQHYTDEKRASDKWSLPDVETFSGFTRECDECGFSTLEASDCYGNANDDCPECGAKRAFLRAGSGWYYWYCLPGCMPDSDPIGPFATHAEALADARGGMEFEEEEDAS